MFKRQGLVSTSTYCDFHPSTSSLHRYTASASECTMLGLRRDKTMDTICNIPDRESGLCERPQNSDLLHNSDELDGIHDGLTFPTDEEKESLRRVPDSIPSNAYREPTAMNLFRIANAITSLLRSLSFCNRTQLLAIWRNSSLGGYHNIVAFR